MDLQLTGKLALVSGSTKGIGLAIATGLARESANVIVNGRTDHSVDAGLAKFSKAVPTAKLEGFAGDLSDDEAVTKELVGSVSRCGNPRQQPRHL